MPVEGVWRLPAVQQRSKVSDASVGEDVGGDGLTGKHRRTGRLTPPAQESKKCFRRQCLL
jgi:hypothetical protein